MPITTKDPPAKIRVTSRTIIARHLLVPREREGYLVTTGYVRLLIKTRYVRPGNLTIQPSGDIDLRTTSEKSGIQLLYSRNMYQMT
jgi:hypothetical protein